MINEGFNTLEDKFIFLKLLSVNFYFEKYSTHQVICFKDSI